MAEASPAAAGFEIRRARPEDIPAALELFRVLDRLQAGWRVFEPRSDLAGEAERRYRQTLDDASSVLFVADLRGRVAGIAHARLTVPSSMSDERAAELSNVFVDPVVRTRGIGRALVERVARWARDQGVRRIVIKTYTQNEEALAFWEALGFRSRFVQMTAVPADLVPPEGP
jgi:GNAT superfamily N-acetyltransferase